MNSDELKKLDGYIKMIHHIQDLKNDIVKGQVFEFAGTVRDLEKEIHQSISDFFNTQPLKMYTEEDMRKCFYAPIHIDGGGRSDTFEDYLKTIKRQL